jgi:hypothetical protein
MDQWKVTAHECYDLFAEEVYKSRVIDSEGRDFLRAYLKTVYANVTGKRTPKPEFNLQVLKGAWTELLMTGRIGERSPWNLDDFYQRMSVLEHLVGSPDFGVHVTCTYSYQGQPAESLEEVLRILQAAEGVVTDGDIQVALANWGVKRECDTLARDIQSELQGHIAGCDDPDLKEEGEIVEDEMTEVS